MDWWEDVKDRLKVFAICTACILVDVCLLMLWVVAQWGLEAVIKKLEMAGSIPTWGLLVFEIIFAVSTLIVVVFYICIDLAMITRRAWRRVLSEWSK